MTGSGEDYFIARQKKNERRKKRLAIVSIISFAGSTVFAAVPMIQRAMQSPPPEPVSVESSLQQQVQGYELVLQKEPENQVALEKLSLLRVQLKDFKGAISPLEKLTSLHPDRQDYKVILDSIKKRQIESDR
ncbi:MAG: tetratricopeptide repeat protein [Trichormus sp. ATA11-4-KO1]|jgi:cytochrome c-type biogenesis protein CcmH/NrfG|nr:tetratricopeptide repeat protein [Trichormus sp. ATA11-4-KO1]